MDCRICKTSKATFTLDADDAARANVRAESPVCEKCYDKVNKPAPKLFKVTMVFNGKLVESIVSAKTARGAALSHIAGNASELNPVDFITVAPSVDVKTIAGLALVAEVRKRLVTVAR